MNTYPVARLAAIDEPVLEKWWVPQHKNCLIKLENLAEATTRVLLEREFRYLSEYPLRSICPTNPVSITEFGDLIAASWLKSLQSYLCRRPNLW